MRRSAALIGIATMLVIGLMIGACSTDTTSNDSPVVTSPAPPPGERDGMGAQVQGVVVLDDRGCVMLELEGLRYPVLWPAGTEWQADPPAVVLADGTVVEPGTFVTGEGGWGHGVFDIAGADADAALSRCDGPTGEVAIFNVGSRVAVG